MDKKQVKAVIDVLKVNKNTGRPQFDYLFFRGGVAYATNGFAIMEWKADVEDGEISKEELEHWYKLAGNKDLLDLKLVQKHELTNVPYFGGVITALEHDIETDKTKNEPVLLDSNYFKILMPAFTRPLFQFAKGNIVKISEHGMTWYLLGIKK